MTAATAAPTAARFADAGWAEIRAFYDALATEPLTAESLPAWLARWSALDAAFEEAASLALVAYSGDTADDVKRAAYLRFDGEFAPRVQEQRVRLADRLLAIGTDDPDMQVALRRFRAQKAVFRAVNIPLEEAVQALKARYERITGAMTAEWDGQELPLPRLAPFLRDPDRAVRERAFRLSFAPYVAARDELADIFDEQLRLRQQIARNAGFANYRDFVFPRYERFDYTPADCAAFHDAVAAAVVPAVARIEERRRQRLGLPSFKPWDDGVDPLGRPGLRPFATGEELAATSQTILDIVDPALGGMFRIMREEHLLDLESRKGKRPGGFCTGLDERKRPFIVMNAAGTHRDVETLLHEGGHAFHVFETAAALPYTFQRTPPMEFAEVASMSMELLSLPYLERGHGGFYDPEDARRAEIEQMERSLSTLTWVATVDAFQHWLYTDEAAADRDARDATWVEIFGRFHAGQDWSGAEAERIARWYRQLHIFLYPFYYIEYGIARLGSLQIWREARRDQAAAVAAYRRALALGGTRSLPELFAAAGARFSFAREHIAGLVAAVEARLAEIEPIADSR